MKKSDRLMASLFWLVIAISLSIACIPLAKITYYAIIGLKNYGVFMLFVTFLTASYAGVSLKHSYQYFIEHTKE